MLTVPFCERSHAARFAALDALDEATGKLAGFHYTGTGITISVPRGKFGAVLQWAKSHELTERDTYYFPLGSDNPHEQLRHDGNYPGSRGFWLYVHFVPVPEVPNVELLPNV